MLSKFTHIAKIQDIAEFSIIARQFQKQPAKLHLLHGHSSVFTVGLIIGSATQQPIAVIDGAVRFNSYTLSKVAAYLGIPAKVLLHRTHVTRAFTAFQTEAAITTKLPRFLATHHCQIVVILGLLDTYYDEQVKPHECQQSLHRILQTLRELVKQNHHILIADIEVANPPKGKENIFKLVKDAVDDATILDITENGFRLKEERKKQLWDETTIHSR
ncbi:MAG: hypothetical protein HZB59_02085 [Ignavibacteriales bacterium]|nr:hypothetical protein [Ignavibacteriales bacterium]